MRTRWTPLSIAAMLLVSAGGALVILPRDVVAQAPVAEAYRLSEVWSGGAGPYPVGYVRQPGGLAATADGTVYLADVERGMIHVWQGDRFIRVFAGEGSGAGQLRSPHGLAILDGDLLVADTANGRVQRFTSAGRLVAAWTGFGEPWDVAVTGDGLVLVTDRQADQVIVLDGDGRRIAGLGGPGTEPGRLRDPMGIDAWPNGDMAVVDQGNRRVQILTLDGTPKTVITDTSELPLLDVAVVGQDGLLVAGLRRIVRYDVATRTPRAMSGAPVPGGFSGVAVVPDPTGGISATMYAALNHDYLTGLRRFRGGMLYPHEEWLSLPGPAGELAGPRRLAIDGDALVILDAWPRMQRWSTIGVPITQTGLAFAGDAEPVGQDTIVATSGAVRRIGTGRDVWAWQPVSGTVWVAGIAHDPAAVRTYVADLRGQSVRVLGADGSEVGAWTFASGTGTGYQAVTDIALMPAGRVALVNRTQARLEVRSAGDGAALAVWPVQGVPLRAAPEPQGGAFVLTREGWIWKLDATGAVRSWWSVADLAPDHRATPSDIALASDGSVLVADTAGDRILVFDPDPAAEPPVPPPDTGCTFVREKRAAPVSIPLGHTVDVTLGLSGVCMDQGAMADVMLVLDRSGSMQGAKMEAARAAAVTFLGEMDFSVARVGLALFSTEATLAMSLTTDAAQLLEAVVAISDPTGGTDIGEGIQVAMAEFERAGRPSVRRAMVVMSDGRPEGAVVDADQAASAAKVAGVHVYTIGFGPDVDPQLMQRMASQPDDYFFAPSSAELAGIYTEIARRISGGVVARNMVVTDTVPVNMKYVSGSAQPPAAYDGTTLRWTVPTVASDWSASYKLEPLQVGTWPTNVEARSRFVDGLGRNGELVFPVPHVTVVMPSKPLYLPLMQKHKCWPTDRHADVALVLDTSSSMTGDKLAAAKDAARAFVEVLRLPEDQAAIIGFNKTVTLAAHLTGERARLLEAIDGLSITPGTIIDGGLRAATAELTSRRTRPGNSRILVLMTDGQNNAGRDPVLAAAREATAAGITIYTVAFGIDADRALMRQVAGSSSRSYLALGAEDLRRIYGQIAGQMGCDP